MANTYTTDWSTVTNGDVTTHNPQTLVPTTDTIRVLNAEIQWEGVDTTTSTTVSETKTNTGTAEATTTTDTVKITNSDSASTSLTLPAGTSASDSGITVEAQYPSAQSDWWEHEIVVEANGEVDATVDYEGAIGTGSYTTSNTFNGSWTAFFDDPGKGGSTPDYTDETRSAELSVSAENNTEFSDVIDVTITIYLREVDETTTTESDTTTVSYPSVPSGYDFDFHYWKKEKNGIREDSDFVYTNRVGDTRSVTSDFTDNTWTLTMRTHGESTTTTTESTQDPRVTQDVSADTSSLTLNDGEQSSWYQLSGLSADSEEFHHDISGSNEARFRIRFEWVIVFPDAISELRISDVDSSTTYRVALADPSDPQLHYNAIRVAVGGATYAVDVTKPTDSNTVDTHRFYHPTHGVLVPRAFDTV